MGPWAWGLSQKRVAAEGPCETEGYSAQGRKGPSREDHSLDDWWYSHFNEDQEGNRWGIQEAVGAKQEEQGRGAECKDWAQSGINISHNVGSEAGMKILIASVKYILFILKSCPCGKIICVHDRWNNWEEDLRLLSYLPPLIPRLVRAVSAFGAMSTHRVCM